jgi:hypothetical protein
VVLCDSRLTSQGFPNIVEDCIYQFDRNKDYGPEFPDPEGECFKTLKRSQQNILTPWFVQGIWSSIYAILNEPRIRANPRFRLFVVSYTGLFNHDDSACDDWSFGIWGGKQPKLTTWLRREINLVIDVGRTMYDRLINHIMFNPKVLYIDANSAFGGHRFCEPTAERTVQAQNANSWLWDLAWPNCLPLSTEREDENVNLTTATWPFCRYCGDLGSTGEFQRPFHPKREGHEAIKNFLKDVLRDEISSMKQNADRNDE